MVDKNYIREKEKMNINHLQYFMEVYRCGSVTQASKSLHISQPSITAAMANLEQQVEIKLFHRERNRIKVTKEGHDFAQVTEGFLKEYKGYLDEVKEMSNQYEGTISIGVPSIMGTFFLPEMIPCFFQQEGVEVKVTETPTLTGLDLIDERELDFALGLGREKPGKHFASTKIMDTEIQLAVHRDHPLAQRVAIEEEDLLGMPLVTLGEGSYHHQLVRQKLPKAMDDILLSSNQISTIKKMVRSNIAIGFIYKEVFKNDENVVCIPFTERFPVSIYLIWRRDLFLSKKRKRFIQFMINKRVKQE